MTLPSPTGKALVAQVVLSLTSGGTERLVVEIARRLHARVPMLVCCLDAEGELAREIRDAGIPLVTLDRQPGFQPSLGGRLRAVAIEHGVKVLHCHQYSPFVYGRLAAGIGNGLGLVYTEHGRLSDAPPSFKRRLINPWLARFPGEIVSVSHDLRRHMLAEGFPARRVSVVHNGIEPDVPPTTADRARARRLLGLADTTCVVGSIARLDPVKQLPLLVAGFARLKQSVSDARLVIVGGGPERESVDAAIRQAGVGDAVICTGSRQDARSLLAAFDIYVNCSASEGISLSILEAMAAEVVVVATAVGGTPEIIADGETGRLLPTASAQGLADILVELASAPSARRAMAQAARRRVERFFSMERMLDDYLSAYRAQGAC